MGEAGEECLGAGGVDIPMVVMVAIQDIEEEEHTGIGSFSFLHSS